jgi:hypothetical protein
MGDDFVSGQPQGRPEMLSAVFMGLNSPYNRAGYWHRAREYKKTERGCCLGFSLVSCGLI